MYSIRVPRVPDSDRQTLIYDVLNYYDRFVWYDCNSQKNAVGQL